MLGVATSSYLLFGEQTVVSQSRMIRSRRQCVNSTCLSLEEPFLVASQENYRHAAGGRKSGVETA